MEYYYVVANDLPFVGLASSEMRSDTHDLDSNTSVRDHVFTVDQKKQKIFYKKIICMKHTFFCLSREYPAQQNTSKTIKRSKDVAGHKKRAKVMQRTAWLASLKLKFQTLQIFLTKEASFKRDLLKAMFCSLLWERNVWRRLHFLLEKLVKSSRMPPTGEMGPQVQNKQAKFLKVDHLYVQTISVKIPDKLFKVN